MHRKQQRITKKIRNSNLLWKRPLFRFLHRGNGTMDLRFLAGANEEVFRFHVNETLFRFLHRGNEDLIHFLHGGKEWDF